MYVDEEDLAESKRLALTQSNFSEFREKGRRQQKKSWMKRKTRREHDILEAKER